MGTSKKNGSQGEQSSAHPALNRRDFLKFSTGSMALAALASGACSQVTAATADAAEVSRAADTKLATAPAIDVHVHVVHSEVKTKPDSTEHPFYVLSFDEKVTQFRKQMQDANIRYAFNMPTVTGGESDPLGIKTSIALRQQIPGILAVAFADPEKVGKAQLLRAERQLEASREHIVAFKAYTGYYNVAPSDPRYVPYIKLAEKYKLPFIFHTGDVYSSSGLLKHAHPLAFDEVAVSHPGVNFVLAHYGCPWFWDTTEVVFKNDNVWADVSALFIADEKSLLWPREMPIDEMLEKKLIPGYISSYLPMALEWGYDKVLYGSDFPIAPLNVYRKVIEAIIPSEQHEKVFRTNAEKLFGIKC